jgi:hypothetical protein
LHDARQWVQLSEEAGGGLHRVACGAVASREHGRVQVSHALETLGDASGKEFATPDSAVVSESGAVKTYA